MTLHLAITSLSYCPPCSSFLLAFLHSIPVSRSSHIRNPSQQRFHSTIMLFSTSAPLKDAQTPMDMPHTTDHGPSRQPLQLLPAVPLNKRPPAVTANSLPFESISTSKSTEPPTPPTTPLQRRHKRASTSAGSISLEKMTEEPAVDGALGTQGVGMAKADIDAGCAKRWGKTVPRPFTKQYRHQGTDIHRNPELGRGVWSNVYRSVEIPSTYPDPPLTPPTSPTDPSPLISKTRVLAVKAPCRRDAHKVLDHEARILTYLHSFPGSSNFLVPFHGYDQSAHSIIMSAIPLNLDNHVKAAAKNARVNFSARTMFDPMIGVHEWSLLATALISGLSFLHSKNCVHGDIKPANILLEASEGTDSYRPLYCDFSSSLISSDTAPSEISALTQDYTSPELLSSLTDPGIPTFPTPAADVYALAVTLLFAAIGESPYASAGKMEYMKLSMAKEGRPLQFAKAGEQAARVRKGGLVGRCLAGAMVKDVAARWDVEKWKEEVGKVLGDA